MSLLDIVSEKYEPSVRGSLSSKRSLSQLGEPKDLKEPRPSVDNLARDLLKEHRDDLKRQAADDWEWVLADPTKLIAFACLEAICQIRESGRIPDTYTAVTNCRNCGDVPIYPGAPDKVDACVWCMNGQTPPPIPGVHE